MSENKERDILDVTGSTNDVPPENMPKKGERPTVSPQEGAYFLDKFLAQKEEAADDASAEEANEVSKPDVPLTKEALQENVVAALCEIYDPEIPVNIYELGLIYAVDVADDFSTKVTMTLTTPHCPVAESMPGEVELKVNGVEGVASAEVDLVWEPPWDMSKMSDEARLELGLL